MRAVIDTPRFSKDYKAQRPFYLLNLLNLNEVRDIDVSVFITSIMFLRLDWKCLFLNLISRREVWLNASLYSIDLPSYSISRQRRIQIHFPLHSAALLTYHSRSSRHACQFPDSLELCRNRLSAQRLLMSWIAKQCTNKHLSCDSVSAAFELRCDHEEVQLPAGEDGDPDAEGTQRPEGLHPRAGHQVSNWNPQQVWEGHGMCTGQSHTGTHWIVSGSKNTLNIIP